MAKNDNYEISDSLWGRTTQYASAVWDSWGKDVDEYVDDVMDTDSRSDEELYASTVLQDSAHSVELVAHLVGSVFSNNYTKERVQELGEVIASTDAYQSTTQDLDKIEKTLHQATEQFMQEHPKVQTAFMATEDKLEAVTDYVTKEAKAFASNHPELTQDFKSIVEIAAVVPAAKAGKIIHQTQQLNKMDKIDYTAPQGRELNGGIPSHVDRNTIEAKELQVTVEAEIGKEKLFDTNQQARVEAHPNTPTLRHDEIKNEEDKIKFKNDRKIEKSEQNGNPLAGDKIEKMRRQETKPNATLAQSHAEIAVIQKAYDQGLTKDAHMFMKVNGKEVCGYCNSDTIAMAKESGLKSITIHDYNIDNTQRVLDGKEPLGPVVHWNEGLSKPKRFDSFKELEEKFPDLPKAPSPIQRPGVLEIEKAHMNRKDVAIVSASGLVLAQGDLHQERSLAQEALELRVDPQSHQNLNQVQDRQSHEPRETNSSNAFENNNDRYGDYPYNLTQQPLEENQLQENTFDSSAKANEIVAKMVEENGWDNDYGNSDDMGRDID